METTMKRLSLLVPALLFCGSVLAGQPITYDIKVVEDGQTVYGFKKTAQLGKGVHLEAVESNVPEAQRALDYTSDKLTIDLGNSVKDKNGALNVSFNLHDSEKYVAALESEYGGLLNIPSTATSVINQNLILHNGEEFSLPYPNDVKGNEFPEPRSVVISASWLN
jgi:hypothetical protein